MTTLSFNDIAPATNNNGAANGSANREPAIAFINLQFAGVDVAKFGLAITATDLKKNPELAKLIEFAKQKALSESRNRFNINAGLTASLSLNATVARQNTSAFDPSMLD